MRRVGGREHAGSAGPPLIQETAGPHSLQVASFINTDGKGPGYPEAGTVSLGTGRGHAGKVHPILLVQHSRLSAPESRVLWQFMRAARISIQTRRTKFIWRQVPEARTFT